MSAARLTVQDVNLGDVYWCYARHHFRQVRIVAKARVRVTVAFRLAISGRLVRQDVHAWNLTTEAPPPSTRNVSRLAPPDAIE